MWRKVLLLSAVSVALLAFLRSPVRQGKGGNYGGGGIIKEKLGELGAAGNHFQELLQDQLVGKRVHYVDRKHSWSGKVIAVEVQPFTEHTDDPREVKVTVETMAGMGDQITAKEYPTQDDYGSKATISLDQISGTVREAHPDIGSSIKVTIPDDVAFPEMEPTSAVGMFTRGYPNMIVAYYSDGYFEVDVTSHARHDSSLPY